MLLKKTSYACMAALLSAFLCSCSDSSSSGSSGKGGSGYDPNSTEANGAYVMITEIMYNAPEQSPLEWVELKIMGGSAMSDMQYFNLHLDGAVTYYFPAEPLDTNEYIVVTNDPDLFKKTYPDFAGRLFGPWEKDVKTDSIAKLSNEGDVIDVKLTGAGDVSCAFSKEPPWPSLADGNGSSLVFVGGNPSQASAWAASKKEWGNPGAADESVSPITIRLNEIQPYVVGKDNGWIELYNSGDKEVDVSGWIFESKYKKMAWTIKKGKVPAKDYLVLPADDESVFGEQIILDPKGGSYYLYETVGGKKTGGESSLLLAASNLSSGIIDVSDGSTAQGAMKKATKGAANEALKVGPLFIDEIYYHPPTSGGVPFEFMEIVNKADTAVNLYVTKASKSKGWKVEGINMEFSSGTIVPAGGKVLLLSDSLVKDTGAIRTDYKIASDVQICLYKGKLSNRGETVAVKQPFNWDPVTPDDTNPDLNTALVQWYYDWSDATLYSDTWKGFEETDGFGKSLQRVDYSTMGYEASAWKAVEPTVGK
ncbi:MAG: lamin tail domain-containing protein [Fibrobacter sp.]|nr:lamin tail domain-containing protein [Fibrobacter sp.]